MIYQIQNEIISAKIDSLGGQLVSLQKDGKEYIWQRDSQFWGESAPILFPVIARLRDNVLTIDGKDYSMPMHGFVKDSELTVQKQSETSITFLLESNDQTKEFYPWEFRFYVTFSLEGEKLQTDFLVENTDDKKMLFALGGHPGFCLPMEEGATFEDYVLEFEKEERLESNHINMETIEICALQKDLVLDGGRVLPIKRSLFDNEAMIFEGIRSRYVDLVHKDSKRGIRFSYGNFPTLAAWTLSAPVEAPFVCLEPWYGMGFRDNEDSDITHKYGMVPLESGESFRDAFSIEIV